MQKSESNILEKLTKYHEQLRVYLSLLEKEDKYYTNKIDVGVQLSEKEAEKHQNLSNSIKEVIAFLEKYDLLFNANENEINVFFSEIEKCLNGAPKKYKVKIDSELKTTEEKESKNNLKKYFTISALTIVIGGLALYGCSQKDQDETNNKSDLANLTNDEVFEETVNNVVETEEINGDYLAEYDFAMTKYGIMQSTAIDYVNRAHKIATTGYLEDAKIEDIIDLVYAVDNGLLIDAEYAYVDNILGVHLNNIADNWLFGGEIPESDITKLEALKDLARTGTELDGFLTRYTDYLTTILKNPNSEEAKNDMVKFLKIMATSGNGFTNEEELLVGVPEEVINDAQLNNHSNYRTVQSVIWPTIPVIYTDDLAPDLDEIQILLLTLIQEYNSSCDQSLSLGGR